MNGVYKLSAKKNNEGIYEPTMKVSNTLTKTTDPGIKQVYRFYDAQQNAIADLIALDYEDVTVGKDYVFLHPYNSTDRFLMKSGRYTEIRPLLVKKISQGKRAVEDPGVHTLQNTVQKELATLHKTYKRLINPHVFKVSLTPELKNLKQQLISSFRGD